MSVFFLIYHRQCVENGTMPLFHLRRKIYMYHQITRADNTVNVTNELLLFQETTAAHIISSLQPPSGTRLAV